MLLSFVFLFINIDVCVFVDPTGSHQVVARSGRWKRRHSVAKSCGIAGCRAAAADDLGQFGLPGDGSCSSETQRPGGRASPIT